MKNIALIILLFIPTAQFCTDMENNIELDMEDANLDNEELDEDAFRFQPIYVMPEEKKSNPVLRGIQIATRVAIAVSVATMLNKQNIGTLNEMLKKQKAKKYPVFRTDTVNSAIDSLVRNGESLQALLSGNISNPAVRALAGLGAYVITGIDLSEVGDLLMLPKYIFSSAKVTVSSMLLLLALKFYFPEQFDSSKKQVEEWIKNIKNTSNGTKSKK